MTTMISYLRVSAIKNTLVVMGMLFLSNGIFAQLDSVSVSLDTITGADPLDSTVMVDIFKVDVTVNDIDFFGEVVTTVYESGSNYPLAMVKYTKQEALDANLISNDTVAISIYDLLPSGSYRVETQVRNFQGANLPIVTTNFN